MARIYSAEDIPLPVIVGSGEFVIVNIPRMSESAYAFFRRQLTVYRKAILIPEKPLKD